MALYGLVADIHGNREALAAALAALERRGAERIACLGDIVGYNADPDECIAALRARGALAVAGNHELVGLGRLDFRRCPANVEYSLRRTRRILKKDSRAWLAGLPLRQVLEDGVVLVHGGVRDVEQYMAGPAQIRENAAWLRQDFPGARVCLFGHSHEQKVYEVGDEEIRELGTDAPVRLDSNLIYFVNPGAVDASRKGGRRFAECALLDSRARTVEFLRVPYDSAASEAKAAVFGFRITPLTERLYRLRRRLVPARPL